MKTKTLLLICLFGFFVGCKKSADPDPRDNFVGSWRLTSADGIAPNYSKIVTIKKETTVTAISMNWFGKTETDFAKLTTNSTGFTFDQITYYWYSDNLYAYEFKNGTAKLNNTTLTISLEVVRTNLNNGQKTPRSVAYVEEYTKQ